MQEPKGDARFHAKLKQLADLHDRKQADYGADADAFANVRASEDFAVAPWIGCMIRANDKMRRIQRFACKNSLQNESVKDSLLDLAVYSIIALVLYEEMQDETCGPSRTCKDARGGCNLSYCKDYGCYLEASRHERTKQD